uniref:Vezatin n=1 Tax=Cacopsylla melanoneura TaxID=428564 RepID=A0A8D8WPZ0_9HEMI
MIECDKCHCFHQATDPHHVADGSDEEIILENNQLYKYLKEQCVSNLLQKPPDPAKEEETSPRENDPQGNPASQSILSLSLRRIQSLCWRFYESQFVDKTPKTSPSKIPSNNVPWESQNQNPSTSVKTADSYNILPEYTYFIEVLLHSQLILKDDLNILDHFIPNKEKYEILSKKYSYQGSFVLPSTLVLGVFGVNKYYFNNNMRYGLPCLGLTVSSYYVLHKLYVSYQIKKYKKDLHNLISILQKYSNLIHKNIQFIRDFENISKIHAGDSGSGVVGSINEKSNKQEWCKLPHLRFNLLASLNAMCSLAYYNVLELVARFPFNPHLDPYIKHGLCCLNLTEIGVADVSLDQVDEITVKMLMKAKYIYFLLLSEFLSRIILCFCPYTSSPSALPPHQYIASLFRLINRTSAVYTEQFSSLESLFNVVTIHKTQQEVSVPAGTAYLVSNPRTSDRKYEELVKTIHCIETYLLFMLTQYKHMETNIGTYQHSDCIINDNVILHDIYATQQSIRQNQLSSLLYNIDCLNILLSQCINDDVTECKPVDKGLLYSVTGGGDSTTAPPPTVHVGYSDYNVANVPDEIFLGIAGVPVTSNALSGGAEDKTFLDEDQVNYYEFERQFSTTVLNELKVKLKDKQVEWKRREKKALETKNMNDFSDIEQNKEEEEAVKEDAHRKRRKRKSITKTHAIQSLSDTEDFEPSLPKPHPPRSARSKPRASPAIPALGTLITDKNQTSVLSTEDFSENNGAGAAADIKYKRLYNLSRSQESYENRETSPSSDEGKDDEATRKKAEESRSRTQMAHDNQVLAAALFTSQSSLAAQIEQVAREWKYVSIEEEFGDENEKTEDGVQGGTE